MDEPATENLKVKSEQFMLIMHNLQIIIKQIKESQKISLHSLTKRYSYSFLAKLANRYKI